MDYKLKKKYWIWLNVIWILSREESRDFIIIHLICRIILLLCEKGGIKELKSVWYSRKYGYIRKLKKCDYLKIDLEIVRIMRPPPVFLQIKKARFCVFLFWFYMLFHGWRNVIKLFQNGLGIQSSDNVRLIMDV